MVRSWRVLGAISVVVAGLVVTAVAVAGAPTAGQWTSGGESGGSFVVKGSAIGPTGSGTSKAITAPSNFKCNSSNLVVKASKIAISNGKFTYDGPAYVDKFRAKTKLGHLTWSGTFTSAKTVKGRVRFTSSVTPKPGPNGLTFTKKKCDSGTKAWAGKPISQESPVGVG